MYISALSTFLPPHVDNATLETRYGLASGSLAAQTGMATRTYVQPGMTQETMAVQVAREALANAGLSLADLGGLIFAASVGTQPIPATAPLIKRALVNEAQEADHTFPAFDVNATCLSVLLALDTAALWLAAGRARAMLIVSSEIASRALPWEQDPATASLFSDGAAALLVTAQPVGKGPCLKWEGARLETFASGWSACQLASGGTGLDPVADTQAFAAGTRFQMQGKELYRLTAKHMPAFLKRFFDTQERSAPDYRALVPHQASPLALQHIRKTSGFTPAQVFDDVARLGNHVAASLPIALWQALQDKALQDKAWNWQVGDRIALIGTSAGVSFGAASTRLVRI